MMPTFGNPILDIKRNSPVVSPLPGQEVRVLTLTGSYEIAVVIKDKYNVLSAENKHSFYNLEFCSERKCWVSTGGVNKQCLDFFTKCVEKSLNVEVEAVTK